MTGADNVQVDGWVTLANRKMVSMTIFDQGSRRRIIMEASEALELAAQLKDHAGF